jgi:hypothetical protein
MSIDSAVLGSGLSRRNREVLITSVIIKWVGVSRSIPRP